MALGATVHIPLVNSPYQHNPQGEQALWRENGTGLVALGVSSYLPIPAQPSRRTSFMETRWYRLGGSRCYKLSPYTSSTLKENKLYGDKMVPACYSTQSPSYLLIPAQPSRRTSLVERDGTGSAHSPSYRATKKEL